MSLKEYIIETECEGLKNITHYVQQAVDESGVKEGVCLVFCPHTTAGITINEKLDPDVGKDIISGYKRAFPDMTNFLHKGGNSYAHLRSSAIGCSETLIITEGKLLLGGWQGVFFCEFEGPVKRNFFVKIL
jgi:secondary thiamine-phosphate synthase enzyme